MTYAKTKKSITALLLPVSSFLIIVFGCFSFAFSQEMDIKEAVPGGLNPHDQIDDEGYILWSKCLICHPEVPDIIKAKSIEDVKLRFEDDIKQGCFRCHPQRMHPGGDWVGASMYNLRGAPDHWIKPPELIQKNIDKALKDIDVILPLEPKTGKIFCATCHNPHERGLLLWKADKGADADWRLRSGGGPICQYCHMK